MATSLFRKSVKIILKIALWAFAVFMVLGGLSFLGKAPAAAVVMILCGLAAMPATWKRLTKLVKKDVGPWFRGVTVVMLLVVAMVLTPPAATTQPKQSNRTTPEPTKVQSIPQKTASANPAKPAETVGTTEATAHQGAKDTSAKNLNTITSLEVSESGDRIVSGLAPADTTYVLLLSNGKRLGFTPDKNNHFRLTLPKGTTPYGSMQLQTVKGSVFKKYRDIGKTYYYSQFAAHPILQTEQLPPSLTKVTTKPGKAKFKSFGIEGFYLPNTTLELTAQKLKAKTNKDGYFTFKKVALTEHYASVSLNLVEQNGQKRGTALLTYFVDTQKLQLHSKLPVTTGEVLVKTPIAFTSTQRDDHTLALGQSKVAQEGKNGEKHTIYRVTYEGDKERGRVLIRETVAVAPVEKVTLIGKYVAPAAKPNTTSASSPAASSAGGAVKMSTNGICHAPGTTYYSRTKNFTPYPSMDACLAAGGRRPLR